MTDSYPVSVSVVKPIRPALKRMKEILFQPFSIRKWLSIGFCSFLAFRSASYSYKSFSHGNQKTSFGWADIQQYIHQHLTQVIWGSLAVLVVFLLIFFVIVWLNCRGQFMFLHCVALNRGEVAIPWKRFKQAAGNLWKFNSVIGLLILINILIAAAIVVYVKIRNPYFGSGDFLRLLPLFGTFLLVVLVFCIITFFTKEFLVPIMFLRGGTWSDGWRELGDLIRVNPWRFTLYILFQIVIGLGILLVLIVAVLCTCCLGGLLLLIPYIGSVLLLPVTVFQRSYSLYYLAQYGDRFDVFSDITSGKYSSKNPEGTLQ